MGEASREALEAAVKMLARRARSEAEVRAQLERKGLAGAAVDDAIARLKELRYLDDEAFAANRATLLLRANNGPRSVARKLAAAGIGEEQARAAIEQGREGASERDLARRALEARRPRVDERSPLPERIRAARWLLGRGFSEEIARALLSLDASSPE